MVLDHTEQHTFQIEIRGVLAKIKANVKSTHESRLILKGKHIPLDSLHPIMVRCDKADQAIDPLPSS